MKLFQKGNALVATFLNIIGLTFAFTALYIIIVQVHYDLTYNHGIKDSDRVYLFTTKDWYDEGKYGAYLNRPLSEKIIEMTPEIENGGLLIPVMSDIQIYKNIEYEPTSIKSTVATLGGVKTIGYDLIEGSWEDWLPGANLAITESLANRLGIHAGDNLKIGSTDFFSHQKPQEVRIAVVYKDMPANSDFSLHDAISNYGDNNIDEDNEWGYNYFVKVNQGVTEEDINSSLIEAIKRILREENGLSNVEIDEFFEKEGIQYKFFPVRDIFFNPIVNSPGLSGNKTTTFTLLGIAILIIIIAFINYFNFFFAMVPVRLKGINTRKILGSSRVRLVVSMIGESVCFVTISLGLAAVLVVIFSHSPYSGLISTSVLMNHHWGMTFITIGVGLVISIISSIFPAYYITSFNPALAIKGSMGSGKKGSNFRTGLIGFQFTISIVLVICAIIINQQRHFLLKHDLGFNKENLLTVEVSPNIAFKSETIENRLLENSSISGVTWADGPIVANGRMGWGRQYHGESIHMQAYPVAWNFLQFMKIPVVEGRDFLRSDEENENGLFIFNVEARDKFGLQIGERLTGHLGDDQPAEIVGFSQNFNFMPLRSTGEAFCFYQFGKNPWRPLRQLYVRTIPGADPLEVKNKITQILSETDPERHPSLWNVELIDHSIENLYIKENNLSKLVNLFTLLAIVISLMGVFGLVMFDTEHRKKEIGIRRINGAAVEEILKMFNLKFVRIVVVSFIISVPLSWWIISVYLKSYAYRTPISIWVFFLALFAVLTITIGVVTIRSFRAATANPVESLRTE